MDKDHSPATFVDVGANHPFRMSNTAMFYEHGWRGIAIDPNPQFATEYAALRPEDTFVNCGVSDRPGTLSYFEFEEPLYNTFDADRAETVNKHYSALAGTREVKVRPLREILGDVWPNGKSIRVLSIDCEGMDCEVIASHDFEKYPTDFICVELGATDIEGCQKEEAIEMLRNKRYQFIAKLCKSAVLVSDAAAKRWAI